MVRKVEISEPNYYCHMHIKHYFSEQLFVLITIMGTVTNNLHGCKVSSLSILHLKLVAFPTLIISRDPPCGIGLVPVFIISRLQKYFSW